MSKYRVDRSTAKLGGSAPCDMNSLLYLGDDRDDAFKAYADAQPGIDTWGKPNATYGVTMAVWTGSDYLVKCQKGGV